MAAGRRIERRFDGKVIEEEGEGRGVVVEV